MRVLIEEYKYQAANVKDILHGINALENIEGYVSLNYVGYFYNTELRDCVFILPKVLLETIDKKDLVFGKYPPEEILNIDTNKAVTQTEKNFIYEFAVWIYRAIVVFQNSHKDSNIVFHKKIIKVGKGGRKLSNTFLDILLALLQFNKDNQSFFFFVLRNLHSGYNKINWTRTIGTSNAIVQDNRPVYLNPVNKKRQINFDEELLVIFFSILNYISSHYGFSADINCNFNLIKGKQFETYLNGLGKVRLQQIKYKYFSDKALELWELCYAFFDTARQVRTNSTQQEYLLVKNFNIVFEAIIDELIGDREIPKGLKEQEDGKRVDHMYTYKGLTTYEEDKPIYYIGDSKYYKRGNQVGKESVYKQFTYARNVIQWNLNLFMNEDKDDAELQYDKKNFGNIPKLRDDVTEGYNIIPNFFISARLNKDLNYQEEIEITDKKHTDFCNRQFENRLFDRDTLLICHYDVNFLYVVSLYARNNSNQKDAWKIKVREIFRNQIQKILSDRFDFYAMSAHPDVNADTYLKEHFQELLGKIYAPYSNKSIFSLALENDNKYEEDNQALLSELKKSFFVERCSIGQSPDDIMANAASKGCAPAAIVKDGVLMVMMENYAIKSSKFLCNGKLAVGIKWTKDSMEIVENLKSLGYVLFHHRNDNDQHLFAIDGDCVIQHSTEVETDRYKSVNTTEMYIVVNLNLTAELDSSSLCSTRKNYTPTTRYDAQYSTIQELNKISKLN